MPIPINRNPDTSYGLLGSIRNFISPPGYAARGPLGSLPKGSQSGKPDTRAVGTQAVLGDKPVYWGGDSYGWQQLNQGGVSATLQSLNRPIVKPVPTGSEPQTSAALGSPAEIAYAAEKSRIAQMTAQNPELQRYEVARQAAVAKNAPAEAVQKAEDIGMQIWAQKYGKTLAPKVKPGQAGYDVIQGVLNAGAMGAPADLPFNPASVLGQGPAQAIPSYAGASDLQPVGTALQTTDFATPQNQFQAQMFNRFLSEKAQIPALAPPTNPIEATYAGATNVQPIGGISLEDASFKTPASQRRADLFEALLNRATVGKTAPFI